MLPFLKKDDKKNKRKPKKKNVEEERKELVIRVPVPEIKKPELFSKKTERAIATIRLPTLVLRVRVDEENLYIDIGYNPQTLSTMKIPKEEIPQRFQKKSYSFVWVYKSQELPDYYVRGRGYLIRRVLAPEYKIRRMKVQSEIKIFFGRFNGKYPKVKAKRGRLVKEGEINFEEKPAEFLIVVEEVATTFDARSKTPIMYRNVFFRLAKIPEKYRPFWEKFDKQKDADTQFSEFYEGMQEEDYTTMEMETYEGEDEEEEGGGMSLLSRLWRKGNDEEDEEERGRDEEEEDDDLPDISL